LSGGLGLLLLAWWLLHVVEWDISVAERWRWNEICICDGAFCHFDVKLLHFVDCPLLVRFYRSACQVDSQSNGRIWSRNLFVNELAVVE
jgi:hypothetical protein